MFLYLFCPVFLLFLFHNGLFSEMYRWPVIMICCMFHTLFSDILKRIVETEALEVAGVIIIWKE